MAEEGTTEELFLLPEQEHRVGLSRREFCRAAQFRILSPEHLGWTEGECTVPSAGMDSAVVRKQNLVKLTEFWKRWESKVGGKRACRAVCRLSLLHRVSHLGKEEGK